MTRFLTSVSLALCAAGGLGAVAVAHPADSASEVVSRTVPVSDLDLHTQAGAKIAAQRIWVAAAYVCGGDTWPLAFDYFACRADAIDRAAASLNAPLVSAALGRKTPANLVSR
jgi:UrcA family protein